MRPVSKRVTNSRRSDEDHTLIDEVEALEKATGL
jgi:hypothetical protein